MMQDSKGKGRAFVYGDHVDTDVIIPARYLNTADPQELAKHCMEDIDPDFVGAVEVGDIIVAGENFGCGSSREHAPIAIRACGVRAVIARSFARIFYRTAINMGLAILTSPEAVDGIEAGDEVAVDPLTGEIENLTRGGRWEAQPFPPFIQGIMDAGGLVGYTRQQLGAEVEAEV